jgi:hypothetical protein
MVHGAEGLKNCVGKGEEKEKKNFITGDLRLKIFCEQTTIHEFSYLERLPTINIKK